MNDGDRAQIHGVVDSLTAAWNAGDARAFAAAFTSDAEFVNIVAMHLTGTDAIARQHEAIFDGIYRGSRNLFTVTNLRALTEGVALAHVAAKVEVSEGPMAGEVRTLATAVLVREGSGWKIAAFQNTREQKQPG